MKRLIALGLLGVALSAGLVLVVQPATKEKMAKVKMVKTHYPSRGKAWTYALKKDGETVSSNTIKNDRVISFIPDKTQLEVCLASGRCVSSTLTSVYAEKGKQIAIDEAGAISPQTAAWIKEEIADSKEAASNKQTAAGATEQLEKFRISADALTAVGNKSSLKDDPNLVDVTVSIPTRFQDDPFVLSASQQANGDGVYSFQTVDKLRHVPSTQEEYSAQKAKGIKYVDRTETRFYVVPLRIPAGRHAVYFSINNAQGKKLSLRAQDEVKKGTRIRMGTKGGAFFVE